MHYSTGYGSSKKQAKTEAAKATLEILLPELGEKIREESNTKGDADLSVSSISEVFLKERDLYGKMDIHFFYLFIYVFIEIIVIIFLVQSSNCVL